jgi:hypothetical protein
MRGGIQQHRANAQSKQEAATTVTFASVANHPFTVVFRGELICPLWNVNKDISEKRYLGWMRKSYGEAS